MARYIDADMLIAEYDRVHIGAPGGARKLMVDAPTADVVPKSDVDRLKKALEAQDAEYTQALQDKARECNMAIDKICIEHRAEYARLHEAHQEELAKAKREVIDDFAKRLLDAFPESNRFARCPAIYYDDYREIIEEIAEKMKEGD